MRRTKTFRICKLCGKNITTKKTIKFAQGDNGFYLAEEIFCDPVARDQFHKLMNNLEHLQYKYEQNR